MRTCTICSSRQRESIDRAIVENEPERTIADRYAVSKTALHRHKAHVRELIKADTVQRAQTLEGDIQTARNRAESLYEMAEGILRAAVEARDLRAATSAIRTATSVLAEARAIAELRGARESANSSPQIQEIDVQIEKMLAERDERVRQKAIAEMQTPPGTSVQ
jgi:hypothetical protein